MLNGISIWDIVPLIIFLILNIGIVFFKRKGQQKDIYNYAYGKGTYMSTFKLTCTLTSALISGNYVLVTMQKVYSTGISYFLANVFIGSLSYILIAKFFNRRITISSQGLSLYEWVGKEYNSQWIRFLMSLCEVIWCIGILAGQFVFINTALRAIFNCDAFTANIITVVFSCFLITYCALGGMKSVASAEILQFSIFMVALIYITVAAFSKNQESVNVVEIIKNNPQLSIKSQFSTTKGILTSLAIFAYTMLPVTDQRIFLRIKMANGNMNNSRNSLYLASFILFSIGTLVSVFALYIYKANPNLQMNDILPFFLNNYCKDGVKGLFATALIAITMSTADAILHGESILISNDIVPFFIRDEKKRKAYKPTVHTTIISSFIIGLAALSFSFTTNDVLSITIEFGSIFIPIVFVPLTALLLKYKGEKTSVICSMICGTIGVILSEFIHITYIGFLLGLIFSITGYIGSEIIFYVKNRITIN